MLEGYYMDRGMGLEGSTGVTGQVSLGGSLTIRRLDGGHTNMLRVPQMFKRFLKGSNLCSSWCYSIRGSQGRKGW